MTALECIFIFSLFLLFFVLSVMVLLEEAGLREDDNDLYIR